MAVEQAVNDVKNTATGAFNYASRSIKALMLPIIGFFGVGFANAAESPTLAQLPKATDVTLGPVAKVGLEGLTTSVKWAGGMLEKGAALLAPAVA
jgi:hypothetical protein